MSYLRERNPLYARLEEVLGTEPAGILMSHTPQRPIWPPMPTSSISRAESICAWTGSKTDSTGSTRRCVNKPEPTC